MEVLVLKDFIAILNLPSPSEEEFDGMPVYHYNLESYDGKTQLQFINEQKNENNIHFDAQCAQSEKQHRVNDIVSYYTVPGSETTIDELMNVENLNSEFSNYDNFLKITVNSQEINYATTSMADLLNVKKADENEFWFSIPFLHGLKDLFKAGANIHFGAYKDAENSLGFSISGNGMLGLYDISYHPPKGNPKK